jgi:signal transduction histidine kinase
VRAARRAFPARRAASHTAVVVTTGRSLLVALAGIAVGVALFAIEITSDHQDSRTIWAVFGPLVGWNFIFTGLFAWRRRPESRIGALMVLLGFAWFLFMVKASDSALLYTASLVAGGLWGGVFLHIGLSFPSGRLPARLDRVLVATGYVIFPLSLVPALLFASPKELGCDHDCPSNLLLVRHDADLAEVLLVVSAALFLALFLVVLGRAVQRWLHTGPFERLQLTPVYVTSLLTFLLVTADRAGAGSAFWWAAVASTGLMPFAYLGGLLRSHVVQLDAQLRDRLEELRASRARLVEAGDAARRRLERDLHDGAQSRLVAVSLLLRSARSRAGDGELGQLLDRASDELRQGLNELRELAHGIHPAVLTDSGLEPALEALVTRTPVPVQVEAEVGERLPPPVESAAYFLVSEALTNVTKYARATKASVAVRRENGEVTVEVADDGVGGATVDRGSGLRGLADRIAALDGTLSLDSPPGRGTRLRAKIPVERHG